MIKIADRIEQYVNLAYIFSMTTILPVASGKGGVGKTIFVTNLGIALAKQGKTVLLIDLDLGGSNLHTCLGMSNKQEGIGKYIYTPGSSLEALIVPTNYERLFFISGDSLIPGTANLNYFTKKKIIAQLQNLVADYIILDLGAGTAYNTLDFFLVSTKGLLVATPETTSILNAYSFIKSALFRLLYRSFPKDSNERNCIFGFITDRIEGTETTFDSLIQLLSGINRESGEFAAQQLHSLYPRVIMNMGRSSGDIALGSKLREIVLKNLRIGLEYIGFIGYDETVRRSIFERMPTSIGHPDSVFSNQVDQVASKLIAEPTPREIRLYEADEDLKVLAEDAGSGIAFSENRNPGAGV